MSKRKWPKAAKTARGDKVIERVLDAAQSLLQEEWLSAISIRNLSEKADVTRASLLYQFRDGWPEIACALTGGVLFQKFDNILLEHLDGKSHDDASSCVTKALMSFVDLAEETGKLVANLRSQMFVWGQGINRDFYMPAQDFSTGLAEVLADGEGNVAKTHIFAAESLTNFALDVAGGVGLFPWTADERRELLRKNVEITVAGINALATSPDSSMD